MASISRYSKKACNQPPRTLHSQCDQESANPPSTKTPGTRRQNWKLTARIDKEDEVDGGGSGEEEEHTRESEPGKVPSKSITTKADHRHESTLSPAVAPSQLLNVMVSTTVKTSPAVSAHDDYRPSPGTLWLPNS